MKGVSRRVEDFNEIFAAMTDSKEPILLVGGHAVNVWALSYYSRAAEEIRPHEPLTSADMDLYATRNALIWLSSRLGARFREAPPREIVLGAFEVSVGSNVLLVEALRSVKGVTDRELACRATLLVGGNEILVPLPHVLLKAKLANAMSLDQAERQDVKHVRLMAIVLREYLLDLSKAATHENEREILEIIRGSVEVAHSKDAIEFDNAYGLTFCEHIPIQAFASSTPKLSAFAKLEFPRRFRG